MQFKKGAEISAKPRLVFFCIILTNILVPLSIDEFTPSLPAISKFFQSSQDITSLTVTVYMVATALSALLSGALSDTFGRRIIILATVPFYLVGTLICFFSGSVGALLTGRFLQGLGVGGYAVGGPGMMSDSFEGESLAKVSSYYSTIYSFIPICSPLIGGYIQDHFGWQSNFLFLGLLALIIYAYMWIRLPETLQYKNEQNLSLYLILRSYLTVLRNMVFIVGALGLVFTWSLIPVFSVMTPYIMEIDMGFSAEGYGSVALLSGFGFLIGNLLNNRLLNLIGSKRNMQFGCLIMIIAGVSLLVFPLLKIDNPTSLLSSVITVMIGAGITFPNIYAKTIGSVGEQGGVAGALITSIVLLGATLVTGSISVFNLKSLLDFGYIMLALTILSSITSMVLLKKTH